MKEVVVVFADEAAPAALAPEAGEPSLTEVLNAFNVALEPVLQDVGAPDLVERPRTEAEQALSRYFRTEIDDNNADALAARLQALPQVESVYVKPEVENPIAPFDLAAKVAAPMAPAGIIPDFVPQQGYLGMAPGGVDANAAWSQPGGDGAGVAIVDVEGGWCFTHTDFPTVGNGGCRAGTPYPQLSWRNHGTAVLGEIVGTKNSFGVTGIAPAAPFAGVSHNGLGSAKAIQTAASLLAAGDIILLEMHRPGPRFNYASRADQRGFIAVEWWPDDFLAIQLAVENGIIVVEAAGNGAEDLGDVFYDAAGAGFPATWNNPFRGAVDSGAIVVGADAPPSGTFGPDRSRLDFSNFGSRVDCQGWGREVVSAGYGDLYAGNGEDEWFTNTFSGTSSASPIVAGVVACLQGVARARGRPLTPNAVRDHLRTTRSPQTASAMAPLTQNIGARPDLAVLVPLV